MSLADLSQRLQRAEGRRQLLTSQLTDAQAQSLTLAADTVSLEQAQIFIQTVAKQTQEQLRFHISDIVQLALDTCFPGEYTFTVDFDIQRGHTIANLLFQKAGHAVDPMEASGGGVVDLASFALRVAAWSLGHTDNVIVLDEPFRFVSVDLRPRAAAIVKELAQRLKLQFIIVTHDPTIVDVASRVFEVSQKDGMSRVRVRDA
jgi:DNA repair exonuclease SbcCD ATPase subunit